ncbi:helix-turn-helix domain-containing protein [Streptomyces sp. NPDC053367]|uniref:helix-turn-helix domain-containing protein n=1 Tax=Streptomyces sp. NPDC053367 TaxID=3365700 RepID=UPI0037D008E4
MRYGQGGGLTDEQRRARERVRLLAAQRFAQGATTSAIAEELRVSLRSVQRWRRKWAEEGAPALVSQGPSSRPRLSSEEFDRLERDLAMGPMAYGWPDERWTLERVRLLIARRFNQEYTVPGVAKLLRRHGWYCQMPAQQADEPYRVSGWLKITSPRRR